MQRLEAGHTHRTDAGFTLLEVSAAFFVLAVGLFGVFQIYFHGLERTRALHESVTVQRVLQNEIETLRAAPFADLTPRSDQPFDTPSIEIDRLHEARTRLTIAPVDDTGGEVLEVTAAIQWRGDRGRLKERSLTTYIAQGSRTP